MPDVKFQRDTQRFECLGLDLNRPVDSVKPSRFPYMKNCRSYLAGRIEPREGISSIGLGVIVTGQNVHSCRRLNDPANGTFQRIIGTGTHLAYGQSIFNDIDTGYSGSPLALVPWKPDASPIPYMYVADLIRMRKINAQGILDMIGYAPPTNAPSVALSDNPKVRDIDTFQYSSTAALQAVWINGGTAGAPTITSAGPGYRSIGTINQILYDSGVTGWASIQPSSMVGITVGERLNFLTNFEIATVQDVFPGSTTISTTIASIIYDSGNSGLCSIYLTSPINLPDVNAMFENFTSPEVCRIVANVTGPDGTTSIRVQTLGTWSVNDIVQLVPSFRVFLGNNHVGGNVESFLKDSARTAVTSGTGYLTAALTIDLSKIETNLAAQKDDIMEIALRVDHPELVTELRVLLDVDAAGAGVGTAFTQNFYYRAFRPSDITPSVESLATTISNRQTVIQNEQTDSPIVNNPDTSLLLDVTTPSNSDIVISQQLETGKSVWTALGFRLSDLVRVGTDDSRSLQNVNSVRVQAIVTGNVNLDIDSWWIGGGYGPDTFDATTTSYLYRHRVRNPKTNVRSNPSPATRLTLNPLRQSILVVPAQYPSVASINAVDLVLDIERFGGSIADWHYVGTIQNLASPSFIDIFPDLTVGGNPIGDITDYQPWPIIGLPVAGTTGQVSGTTVNDSAANFNTSWAMGTRIIIANQPYTIYRMISASRMEIVENAGNQIGVMWHVNEPIILAQPMPCLWEQSNTFFACGDPVNPGRLYWSNPNSETTTPANWIDITSPSEPLMNGLNYNIRSYVLSSENFFQILSTSSFAAISENSTLANSPVAFEAQKIPNGKGLYSRWALTRNHSPVIAFLAKDGIYATTGGKPIPLTDADLSDLFPNEGSPGPPGTAINGVSKPLIDPSVVAQLRLEYYDDYLYFDYPTAIDFGMTTLVLAFSLGAAVRGEAPGGWFWDVYSPGVIFHYGEEGPSVHMLIVGGAQSLFRYGGPPQSGDDGTPFSMELTTPSRDQGDARSDKFYGDIMLDSMTANLPVTCTPFFDNNSSSAAPTIINTINKRLQTPIGFGAAWQTARNISLNLVVSISSPARPLFYIWEPRWTFESAPISALSWNISPSTFGMENFKSIGICKITHVSSVDINLIFTIDGVVQPTVVIPNSGGVYKQNIFRVIVMKGKIYQVYIATSDGVTPCRLDPRDSFFEVKNWGSDGPYDKLRIFSDFAEIQG